MYKKEETIIVVLNKIISQISFSSQWPNVPHGCAELAPPRGKFGSLDLMASNRNLPGINKKAVNQICMPNNLVSELTSDLKKFWILRMYRKI